MPTRHNPSDDPLSCERFPRSSRYDAEWLKEQCFGAHPLWLAEWLSQGFNLQPGMRVLDLGCGRAKTSVFLAREFGVHVWAADMWIAATENWQRICEAKVEDLVTPLAADARNLPFAHGFFDAILAVDSMQYFGTDELFLPYILQFLQPSGILGFASAGLVSDFEGDVPQHLAKFWTSDAWCLHTADWWAAHWERTRLVNVQSAETMRDGWRLWKSWAVATEAPPWYQQTVEDDAGRFLGYICVRATKRRDGPELPYDLRTGQILADDF